MTEDDYLLVSAIQHYAYCPRQCALIHIEQIWLENLWTAEGRALHARVDAGGSEQRGNLRSERGVMVISHRLRIRGKLDLLEVQGKSPVSYFPVEYKRGKPKLEVWDKAQLCAQVLCLEEMRNVQIKEAALWYWQIRHREIVSIDEQLREKTEEIISAAHSMIESGITPRALFSKRCNACSLIDLCEPQCLQHDNSKVYVNSMYSL
ncbi:TPA: CRISPR-associated protein Cas4 [Legionella pneumophila]|nr:CRISPR-associated protein Cas4 [Legionella pneumophila]